MIFKFKKSFSCAHFYHQSQWSQEKNQQEFGKCFTAYGHGHDYVLEIEIEGTNLIGLSGCVQKVIDQIDHQHVNYVIPEFKNLIPTTENMSLYLHSKISAEIKNLSADSEILSLTLNENPEIWVEIFT